MFFSASSRVGTLVDSLEEGISFESNLQAGALLDGYLVVQPYHLAREFSKVEASYRDRLQAQPGFALRRGEPTGALGALGGGGWRKSQAMKQIDKQTGHHAYHNRDIPDTVVHVEGLGVKLTSMGAVLTQTQTQRQDTNNRPRPPQMAGPCENMVKGMDL